MKILTIHTHTAYLYLLSKVGYEFDVFGGWDENSRPRPQNINLISLNEAKENLKKRKYKVFIAHRQFQDLKWMVWAFFHHTPVVLIFHGKKERSGYRESEIYKFKKRMYNDLIVKRFLPIIGKVKFVFITPKVKESWKLRGKTILPGVDINDFLEYQGEERKILIVGNSLRRPHFAYDILLSLIRDGFPIKIIGENPDFNTKPAKSFEELKKNYSCCRGFLYLAHGPEEGFNLSLLEAMASGMPIVTLPHPTSPIIEGYNGFTGRNLKEIKEKINLLLENKNLAIQVGKNAKNTVEKSFNINNFIINWQKVINSFYENSN